MEHTISGKPVLVTRPLNQDLFNCVLDSMLQDKIEISDHESKGRLSVKFFARVIETDTLMQDEIVMVIRTGTIDDNLHVLELPPTWGGYADAMKTNPLGAQDNLSVYDAEIDEYFDVEYICQNGERLLLVIKHDD